MLIIFAINQMKLDGFRNTNENNEILCNIEREKEEKKRTLTCTIIEKQNSECAFDWPVA